MDKRTNKHTEWQLHFLSCLSQLEMSSRDDNRDRKVPVPRIQFLNSRDVPRNQKKNSRDDIKDNKVPVPRIQFWISRDSHPWFILGTSLELNFLTLGTSLEWIRDGYHNLFKQNHSIQSLSTLHFWPRFCFFCCYTRFCQAQPKPKLNLAGLSLALFFISPTTGRTFADWTSTYHQTSRLKIYKLTSRLPMQLKFGMEALFNKFN